MSSLPALWQTSHEELATLTSDTTQAHSSSASAKITASSGTSSTKTGYYITPVVPVVPGARYLFSYWAKATGDPGGVSQGLVVYNDHNDDFISAVGPDQIPAGTTDWTSYATSTVVPANAAYVQLFVVTYANSGSVWFDDVGWVEIVLTPIYNLSTSGGSPTLKTTGGTPSLSTMGGAPTLNTKGPT